MKLASGLRCHVCGKVAALKNHQGETPGDFAYRIGWRARCDQAMAGWSQYCPKHAPADQFVASAWNEPSENEPYV